jgi:hypothetical protein
LTAKSRVAISNEADALVAIGALIINSTACLQCVNVTFRTNGVCCDADCEIFTVFIAIEDAAVAVTIVDRGFICYEDHLTIRYL